MKKITENELKNKVSRLREYLAVIEAATPGMGQKGPTVAAAQGADPSNPLNQAPYNAAKDSQAANVPAAAPSAAPAAAPATQSTKPAAPARPTAKSDPNVKALQDKLIAAGAKIKADGIMGPATRAAQQQFPNVTTQTDAEKAVSADLLSANDGTGQNGGAAQVRNPNAGLAPTTSMDDSDDAYATAFVPPTASAAAPATAQSTKPAAPANPYADNPAQAAIYAAMNPADQQWATKGGGKPDLTDPYIAARSPNKFKPAAAPAPAPVPAAQSPYALTAKSGAPGLTAESVSFRNDELSRIVSLVRHR